MTTTDTIFAALHEAEVNRYAAHLVASTDVDALVADWEDDDVH